MQQNFPNGLLYNFDWMNEQYITKRRNSTNISQELGVDRSTVLNNLKKLGIKTRKNGDSHKNKILFEKNYNWFYKYYITDKIPIYEMCKLLKTGRISLKQRLTELKISLRKKENIKVSYSILYKKYIKERKSTYEIAEELKIPRTTLVRRMEKLNIPLRSMGESHEVILPEITKEWLEKEYLNKKRTMFDIGLELDIGSHIIRKYIFKFGIPTRSPYEYGRNVISGVHRNCLIPLLKRYDIKHITSYILPKLSEQLPSASSYEIDEYLPDCGIFLELYGDYWHKTSKARIIDSRKQMLLKKHYPNIRVVIIWEHQLKNGEAEKIIRSLTQDISLIHSQKGF